MIPTNNHSNPAAPAARSGAPSPRQEFHIRRSIRDALGLHTALFSISGTVVFADLQAARQFAFDLERYRISTGHPDPSVRAGDIVAMGVLDEILHHLLAVHRAEQANTTTGSPLDFVSAAIGPAELETTLRAFCEEFPPAAVYRGEQSLDDYLESRVDGVSGRERTLEEIVLLRLTNENPACSRYRELIADDPLAETTAYASIFSSIEQYYDSTPVFDPADGAERRSVLDLLRAPARAHPNSLEEQLAYARDQWGAYVGKFISRILRSLDVLKEESKVHADPGAGPPPAEVYSYEETEEEGFSPDTEWMPGVVMIAKSTLVWLYQLSERYGRKIDRLDEVPDEELDRLAASGFNALWLIGLWERSPASRRIKHLSGNPDAEASAYALYSYDIAAEVGGWGALETLRRRCSDRGIRLASDMVPNHTGIDSPWVHDHPDWYVHLDHPPFPSYTFSGENLSGRGDVSVSIEDHYFDRTDAAVVFKHVDSTGRERFIYHGNDGTSMPWNDTAQLNYLNPEVRETVIQTILHVARNFPVIRFDAAMTLAKRHFRRLWFPEPGAGGDIASRSEHGLTREEFDRAMPKEFWREVVDRVATEAPGTLLLAEAFWMMEGYFVRTLGMHRVYNSAFMNMLKREQNSEYREIIRNTLSFDPEILKRFVNFMNNPDEETSVTQFGTGDKYFGVCTLLATMPGLPMFGHGQVEGLAEKYGMEFRRPYWDESPDLSLIDRHEREIFPLIRRRELFASASHFRLYDLRTSDGGVNENVFAYSNAHGNDRVIVVYNNSFEHAAGTLHRAAPVATDSGALEPTLHEALRLSEDQSSYLVLQDQRTGLWFIHRSARVKEQGLTVALSGYGVAVFWNVHERLDDDSGRLGRLADELDGVGVPDIDRALAGLVVEPVRRAFRAVATETLFTELDEAMQGHRPLEETRFAQIRNDYRAVLERAASISGEAPQIGRGVTSLERHLSTIVSLPHHAGGRNESTRFKRARGHYYTGIRANADRRRLLSEWTLLMPLVDLMGVEKALSWGVEAWTEGSDRVTMLRAGLRRGDWASSLTEPAELIRDLLSSSDILELIGFHTHSGIEYYHLESMDEVLWWLFAIATIRLMSTSTLGGRTVRDQVERAHRVIQQVEDANASAQGRADRFMLHGRARATPQARSKGSSKA
ncbi:MAG: alpha-amylase family glycosyl hydrolase [Spirochaetota bacterium]